MLAYIVDYIENVHYAILVITGIIGATFLFLNFTSDRSKHYGKERYEKLVFPLFKEIEPYMMTKNQQINLSTIIQIFEMNSYLLGGKLMAIDKRVSKLSTEKNTVNRREIELELCKTIDKEYDKSCRKLGLAVRSYTYRMENYVYSFSKRQWILFNLGQLVILIVFMFIMLTIAPFLTAEQNLVPVQLFLSAFTVLFILIAALYLFLSLQKR